MYGNRQVASSVQHKQSSGHRDEWDVGDGEQPESHGVRNGLGQRKSGWKQTSVYQHPMVGSLGKSDTVLGPIAALELGIDVLHPLQKELQTGRKCDHEAVALEQVEKSAFQERRGVPGILCEREGLDGSAQKNSVEVLGKLSGADALSKDPSVPAGIAIAQRRVTNGFLGVAGRSLS